MSTGLKANADGSAAIQVGGSDAITITSGLVVTMNGGAVYPITSGTAVASTSGTSIDFTGIPSTAKRITVMFNGVSGSGTSVPLIQIGSGSITTTSYSSTGLTTATTSLNSATYTTGFGLAANSPAAATYTGIVQLKAKAAGDVGKKVVIYINDGTIDNFVFHTLTANWTSVSVTETTSVATTYFSIGVIGSTFGGQVQGAVAVNMRMADCRLAVFAGMNLSAYQRVGNGAAGTADYDTVGFRPMLYFDGTNDALATPAIDWTGTDSLMALCNVLKVSDAAQGMVYETTASSAANNGSMFISAPAAASATFSAGSRGTALATATSAASYAAPNLACLRFDADVSADSVALLRQAASIATSATDQGTGNYSSAALYIGARAGTSLFFKGYMIPGFMGDTTGIPTSLLDQMAREQAALWGVAI